MKKERLTKLFSAFFIVMFGCSVLSRAADSLTVARVEVASVNRGSLKYEVYGTGTVEENASKYVEIESGLKVRRVYGKEGTTVKKGDKLFAYDMGDLKEAWQQAEREYEKARIGYERARLSEETADTSVTAKKQELAKTKAKEELAQAKKNLKQIKEALKEEKKEALRQAKIAYEEVKASKEEALLAARRRTEDAQAALEKKKEPEKKVRAAIENFRVAVKSASPSTDLISEKREALFFIYYGDSYDSHKKEVERAGLVLKRAKEDLWDIQLSGTDTGEGEKAAKRAVLDAEEALSQLLEKDAALSDAILRYQNALTGGSSQNSESTQDGQTVAEAESELYGLLYQKQGVKEEDLADALQTLERAKEDASLAGEKWEKTRKEAKEKYEKAQKEAEESVADAPQFVSGEEAVRQARLNLEQVRLDELQAGAEEKTEKENAVVQEKAKRLELEAAALDLEEAGEKQEKYKKLLEEKGCVTSPSDGILTTLELSQGAVLSGSEKVMVALDQYQFTAQVSSDELAWFQEGDEIKLTRSGSGKAVSYPIDSVSMEDGNGNKTISVILPKESYTVGSTLSFHGEKDSKMFESCIPIQALRKDNTGYYVLVVTEKPGVLGKEKYLLRMGVELLSKDASKAAVVISLKSEDKIVTGSNKNVQEKDRVRIYEE